MQRRAPTPLHQECTEQRGGSASTVEGCWRRPTWPGTNELVEDGSRGGGHSPSGVKRPFWIGFLVENLTVLATEGEQWTDDSDEED